MNTLEKIYKIGVALNAIGLIVAIVIYLAIGIYWIWKSYFSRTKKVIDNIKLADIRDENGEKVFES